MDCSLNSKSFNASTVPRISQNTVSNDVVAKIVSDFVDLYTSPEYHHINPTNERLEEAMHAEMEKWNLTSPILKHTVRPAATLIELAAHNCTFEEKRRNALYNWYIIYLDDAALKNPVPYTAFQQRFISSLPQLDPVLDALAAILHEIVEAYPPWQANLALSTTFEFFTTACAESHIAREPSIDRYESKRLSLYMRERTGLGITTGVLLFSPSQPTSFVNCYRALPDMAYWISAANDILSFYKEQKDGEHGYIHALAAAEGRSVAEALSDLKNEASAAGVSAEKMLAADPAAVKTWRLFQYGFAKWHLMCPRYRLDELSIACRSTTTP